MKIDKYEFYYTPVGYNQPKEFHIFKHISDEETISNIVFLSEQVEETFNKLVKNKDDIRIKILLYKWLFAKEYGFIETIPNVKSEAM